MLVDLFSHKIHATYLEVWAKRLVRLASIFHRFDNQEFDRARFDESLRLLAPTAARSPFRDQYSIYISVLGVGHIVWHEGRWLCHLSDTARNFLIGIEPDVEAFCRLQLAMYQRPDGRGQMYTGRSMEHSSSDKTLELLASGYRTCPFRFMLKLFEAKAVLDGVPEDEIEVTPEEVYALINSPRLRGQPSPPFDLIAEELDAYRRGTLLPPEIKRKTFAFLEATGLVVTDAKDNLRLKPCATEGEWQVRNRQIERIRQLDVFYDGFANAHSREELGAILRTGEWANYFDAVRVLHPGTIDVIAGRDVAAVLVSGAQIALAGQAAVAEPVAPAPTTVEFGRPGAVRAEGTPRPTGPVADPEETRLKRERRNSYHDLILRLLRERVRQNNLQAKQSDYIDLMANVDDVQKSFGEHFQVEGSYLEGQDLPYFPKGFDDGVTFLFEVKSSDDQIVLAQIRKAVSQLYEYRYRYSKSELKRHVVLVVALQSNLAQFPWLLDYLLHDRRIAVCWLDDELKRILCPKECIPVLQPFVDGFV